MSSVLEIKGVDQRPPKILPVRTGIDHNASNFEAVGVLSDPSAFVRLQAPPTNDSSPASEEGSRFKPVALPVLEIMQSASVPGSVRSLLAVFAKRTDGYRWLTCKMSHGALAAEIGCTRRTVINALHWLREKGYVAWAPAWKSDTLFSAKRKAQLADAGQPPPRPERDVNTYSFSAKFQPKRASNSKRTGCATGSETDFTRGSEIDFTGEETQNLKKQKQQYRAPAGAGVAAAPSLKNESQSSLTPRKKPAGTASPTPLPPAPSGDVLRLLCDVAPDFGPAFVSGIIVKLEALGVGVEVLEAFLAEKIRNRRDLQRCNGRLLRQIILQDLEAFVRGYAPLSPPATIAAQAPPTPVSLPDDSATRWGAIKAAMRGGMSEIEYTNWIGRTRQVSENGLLITVQAPDDITIQWLESEYRAQLAEVAGDLKLNFVVAA